MITGGYCLGVDYGTSNTAAVIHEPGGRTRPLLFDGFPQLPSSVCVGPDGQELLVGREAIHAARVRPERFEPHPKRRIDDGTVLLGDAEFPVPRLIAAALVQVRAEAVRTMGAPPAGVALTYPAAWAARRRAVLVEAARLAELAGPAAPAQLVPEPVAAASYFAQDTGAALSPGDCVVVYDFGAGTFDASVVRRTERGWDVAASDGLADAGGLDVDAAIVAYLGAVYSTTHPEAVRRLEHPESTGDRRARRNLWEDVRTAKEILSRSASTYVHLPILDQDAPLGREQVERLAAPVVARTVALTRSVIAASVPAGRLTGLFLVGGSSRIPLVATALHRVTGTAPTVMEQPELAVAQGSVAAFDAPPRIVRPRAEIRERAAVPGADTVSEDTIAIIAHQTAPAAPSARSRVPAPRQEPAETPAEPAAAQTDEEPKPAGRGAWSLAVGVLLVAGLVAMTGLGRTTMPEWHFWLGDALLYPGYALWLAYLFGLPGSRTQWRAAIHVVSLLAGCLAAYTGAAAVAHRWGTTPLLWVLGAVVAVAAAGAALWRAQGSAAVFGRADAAGLVLALTGFGAAHGHDHSAAITIGVVLAGGPAAVAFVGAGAALGRYVAAREPGAHRWLPRTAALLLLAGAAATTLRLAAAIP
ncbi:Hsp70 family protein [Dactylosporangium vinaceum]|uniref:Hsp70 family protein n=1 Tax=Dactylosporangium vinaceum TaxID=53362 RepID=A0ABV5MCF6_9ACTN|nr:Hsp70 family protein [Dactylosporangium vinaceum]UAB92153.1 Hsp70 family protein [Dactylosporangium vinaceum]